MRPFLLQPPTWPVLVSIIFGFFVHEAAAQLNFTGKSLTDIFWQLDYVNTPTSYNPLRGGQNYTTCCLKAINDAVEVAPDGHLQFVEQYQDWITFEEGQDQPLDLLYNYSLRNQFPCTAVYNGDARGAPVVKVNYTWLAKTCPGWQISSKDNLNAWLQPLSSFLIPAIIFCMSIPRRRKLEVPPLLFSLDQGGVKSYFIAPFGAIFAGALVSVDTILWLCMCFAFAGPMIISGLYEAKLDNSVLVYLRHKIDEDRLTMAMRCRLLLVILIGNLDLNHEIGDSAGSPNADGGTYAVGGVDDGTFANYQERDNSAELNSVARHRGDQVGYRLVPSSDNACASQNPLLPPSTYTTVPHDQGQLEADGHGAYGAVPRHHVGDGSRASPSPSGATLSPRSHFHDLSVASATDAHEHDPVDDYQMDSVRPEINISPPPASPDLTQQQQQQQQQYPQSITGSVAGYPPDHGIPNQTVNNNRYFEAALSGRMSNPNQPVNNDAYSSHDANQNHGRTTPASPWSDMQDLFSNLKVCKTSEKEKIPLIGKAKTRLKTMLHCQYSFGSVVGAPVVFFLGGFIFALLQSLETLGDESIAEGLAFGQWYMTIPHIAIVSGLLLAGNNPNILEGVLAVDRQYSQEQDNITFMGFTYGLAYPSRYKVAWLWDRGYNKKKWLSTLIATDGDSNEAKDIQDLKDKTTLFRSDWLFLLFLTVLLLGVPFILAFLTAFYTPEVGLSCRSLTFTIYILVQACQIILWLWAYATPSTISGVEQPGSGPISTWLGNKGFYEPYSVSWMFHEGQAAPRDPFKIMLHMWNNPRRLMSSRLLWNIIYYTSQCLLGIIGIMSAIGGTLMQLMGVYSANICFVTTQYWFAPLESRAQAIISVNSADMIRKSELMWKPCAIAGIVFMGFVSFVGWWYQRRMRDLFQDQVHRIDSYVREERLPQSNNVNYSGQGGGQGRPGESLVGPNRLPTGSGAMAVHYPDVDPGRAYSLSAQSGALGQGSVSTRCGPDSLGRRTPSPMGTGGTGAISGGGGGGVSGPAAPNYGINNTASTAYTSHAVGLDLTGTSRRTPHSVRRAVLRSAASASASVTRTAASTSITPLIRSVAAQAARRPAVNSLAIAARYFSQTARVAEEANSPAATPAAAPAEQAAEQATEKSSEEQASEQPSYNANDGETPYGIYIRNIVFDATEAHLKEAFEHYGPVSRCVIARDARGMSRGYGFIWFESADAKEKAKSEANGSFWHGRRIEVGDRQPRTRPASTDGRTPRPNQPIREPTDSLYIGNLPYETTDADLNTVFGDLKGLLAVRVAVDRATGWPRGFAHADFDTKENAIAGLEFLKNKQVGTRSLRVDYAQSSRNRAERYREKPAAEKPAQE